MPNANLPEDGTLAVGVALLDDQIRASLSFQIAPRLTASFRYAQPFSGGIDGISDQSLSLQYRLMDETAQRPAIVIGFNDVLGTDLYRSEFIAASKNVSQSVRITAGLGWGRLAGAGGFNNPLAVFSDTLSERDNAPGSNAEDFGLADAFRGDAAHFGGVEWQATDRLRLLAEYSSLDYGTDLTQNSPFNFGLSYQIADGLTASAAYLYGAEVGVQLTYAFDAKSPPVGASMGSAPLPVRVRGSAADLQPGQVPSATAQALAAQGLSLHGLTVSGQTAWLDLINRDHTVTARAIGRAARALSHTMPASVSTFEVSVFEAGIPVNTVRLDRRDIEALEHDLDGAWLSYVRAQIGPPGDIQPSTPGLYPQFEYGITPYVAANISDPNSGILADIGFDLNAQFAPTPGLVFSGTLRQRLGGTVQDLQFAHSGDLPRVRSDLPGYAQADTTVSTLTGAYYFNAGDAVYGRVTAGLLEPMFGGLSTELLLRPADSAFAIGAEVNYAVQRDVDQLFGFQDYDVLTGHVSGYWDFGGGYQAQLDLGRYLAGDWGGTLALERKFDNGWRIGAFATVTDVGFDDFGQGDFDRGIMVSIPVGWASGGGLRDTADVTLRPVLGDGGARLAVDGRLYDLVAPSSGAQLARGWAEFWR